MRIVQIISTTDGKYVGATVETDMITFILPSGETIDVTGRFKDLDGMWRLWNSNYIIEVKEVEIDV